MGILLKLIAGLLLAIVLLLAVIAFRIITPSDFEVDSSGYTGRAPLTVLCTGIVNPNSIVHWNTGSYNFEEDQNRLVEVYSINDYAAYIEIPEKSGQKGWVNRGQIELDVDCESK